MADKLLRVLLEIVPKSTNAFQKALGGTGGASAATGRDTSKHLESITSGFSNMHKQLALLNTSMRPDLLAKQVDLEIKLANARKKYADAHEAATNKAKGVKPPGKFGKILNALGLGDLFGGGGGGGGGGGMSGLFGAIGGDIGGGFTGIAGMAGPVGAAASASLMVVNTIKDKVVEFFDKGMAAVGMRSPATVERFQRAIADTTAVLGESFIPVMELVTDGVRLWGDFLKSILPDANEVREMLAPLKDAMKDFRDALAPIAPIIRDFIVVNLKIFAVTLGAVIKPLAAFAKMLSWMVPGGGGGELKSSVGMAATTASYIGAEELGRATNAAAFAGGATESAEEQTANNTSRMAAALDKLVEFARPAGGAASAGASLGAAIRGWLPF